MQQSRHHLQCGHAGLDSAAHILVDGAADGLIAGVQTSRVYRFQKPAKPSRKPRTEDVEHI